MPGASIKSDATFELMMRNTWHIAGGDGGASASNNENTTNMRVVVTFEDNKKPQEIITLEDDLGVAPDDWPLIRKKLFLQGVRDVAHVEPCVQGDSRDQSFKANNAF